MKDDLIRRKDAIDAIMSEYPEPHYPDWYWMANYRYCPSCGRRMVGDPNVPH